MKGTLSVKGVAQFLVEFRVFHFCGSSVLNFLQEVFLLSVRALEVGSLAMKLSGVIFFHLCVLHCECNPEFKRFCCK